MMVFIWRSACVLGELLVAQRACSHRFGYPLTHIAGGAACMMLCITLLDGSFADVLVAQRTFGYLLGYTLRQGKCWLLSVLSMILL